MTPSQVKQQLCKNGIISIIRGDYSVVDLCRLAEALQKGGVNVIEVTLNSAHALTGIRELVLQFGEAMQVGAGTVRTAQDVAKAADAGASFLLAPCLDLASTEAAAQRDTLLLPGIFTASEAQAAFVAGCQTVKLFPATLGGPNYLKALRAPLEHIDFVPTGGVTQGTLGAFHKAGAAAFGVGSALVKNVELSTEELRALSERASVLTQTLKDARA